MVSPLPRGWANLGGVGAHRSRPLGNWQSDNAIDMGNKPGTPVYAVEDGQVSPTAGFGFKSNGRTVWGHRFTLRADSGRSYFYTHLGGFKKGVYPGARLVEGQHVGWLGNPPGFPPHLHFAAQPPTNPETVAYGRPRRPLTREEKLRNRKGFLAWKRWWRGKGPWAEYGPRNPKVRPDVPARIPRRWWRRLRLLTSRGK